MLELYFGPLVVDGDFIMSNSMSFGKPYIVKTKGAIHDGWLLMREKIEKTDKDFFYYLLSSNYMYEQFSSKASGTTVKNLNIDMVKTTNIPLPPFEEQKRIVVNLDNLFAKIDKAIALHQKNIDEADIFMASVLNDVFVELEEKSEIKRLNEDSKVDGILIQLPIPKFLNVNDLINTIDYHKDVDGLTDKNIGGLIHDQDVHSKSEHPDVLRGDV